MEILILIISNLLLTEKLYGNGLMILQQIN